VMKRGGGGQSEYVKAGFWESYVGLEC